MSEELQALFAAVRAACSARAWSTGIELCRTEAVDGVEEGAGEVVLRVKVAGRAVAPSVRLYPDDAEWACDCDAAAEACEHVAAAVIALRQARQAGQRLPRSGKVGGSIVYRLERAGDRVVVWRSVRTGDGRERPLAGSLGGLLSGREPGPAVAPSPVDLSIDRFLALGRVRSLPPERFATLLSLLAEVEALLLDGEPVGVDLDPARPEVHVADGEDRRGFVLRLLPPAGLRAVVVSGVGLFDGATRPVLRPFGAIEATGPRLERLPHAERFGPERVVELVTTVLPAWRTRAAVHVDTSRLPDRTARLPVRAIVEVSQRGAALSALPLLVYGDPPCARVVGAQLEHLGGPIPERDERAERRAREALEHSVGLVPGHRREWVGAEAVAMAVRLRACGSDVVGDAHLTRYPEQPLGAEARIEADRLDLRFCTGALEADPGEVLAAWRRGEALVPLTGGGWAPIPADWLERHGDRVRALLDARDGDGTLPACARPALAAFCDEIEHPRPPALDRLAPLVTAFETLPRAVLPRDLAAELRDYQRRGVDWLCFLREAGLGAVLADDMGLGKTVQALSALCGRALVVCPRSVVHNWVDEIRRFRPGLRVDVYHGAERALCADDGSVTLTTYALLRRDEAQLGAVDWDVVVLDEAQAIKNPDTDAARAAYRLRAGFRLALSGTPVENRLAELWSLLHFTNRGLLGGRETFRDGLGAEVTEGRPGAAARLRERIRPFVLRRLKREVATELPARSEAVLHCELDVAEREIYDAIRVATQRELVARLGRGGSVMAALEALLRLRQAACDAALLPGHAGRPATSSKLRRLRHVLEQTAADGHKALVFSQWTGLLDRVEPELERAGLDWVRLDGSTVDRAGVVAAFQRDDGPPVMLLSLTAGGTGLNLTAADHVLLLDPWWNPAVEDQAADRAHRIGQDKPVMIYRLVAKDTVEERILELQQRKRRLADAALGEAGGATAITREDLLALLA